MAERRASLRILYSAAFLLLAGVLLFLRLLPVQDYGGGVELGGGALTDLPVPGSGFDLSLWPGPDVVMCLALAWVVRRPDLLPAPVIAGYFLLEDMLLLRPPGSWALVMLLATEFLRARNTLFRGAGLWLEFALVTGLLLVMFVAHRALLAIVMVPLPPLDLSFAQLVGSVLVYPAVVAFVHFVLNLRKPATGELDGLGQKL